MVPWPEGQGEALNSQNVLDSLREFAARRGVAIEQLSAAEAIDLMASFYREVRADDCDLDADGDMLLFQWGLYDWGKGGESFTYDITRQLIPAQVGDSENQHGFIGQLSLTLGFSPSASLRAIGAGNRWCFRPAELDEFLSFVRGSEATRAVSGLAPATSSLTYENVE